MTTTLHQHAGAGAVAGGEAKFVRMAPNSPGMIALHSPEIGLAKGEIDRLAHVATQLLRMRQARADVFDADIFSEPGWNILLDLFISWASTKNCSVSDLCIASAAPATTALRWLAKLDRMGLIARTSDGEDRRRSLVFLSPHGQRTMIAYLSRVNAAFR